MENLRLLHAAVEINNFEAVENLIKKGVDINSRLEKWTPLYLAAFSGFLEIAKLLVENGCDIKGPSIDGLTPLQAASSTGRLNIIKYLVERGADPKDTNEDGWTSLHAAAQNGNLKVVEYFLNLKDKKSIDINVRDKKMDTPLHTATFHGQLDVVEFLCNEGATINTANAIGATPLLNSALNNEYRVFEYLVNKGATIIGPNDNGTLFGRLKLSSLHMFALYDNKDMIKKLVGKGLDKNGGKDVSVTPLHFAVLLDSSETVKYLIENGADKNVRIELSKIIDAVKDAVNNDIQDSGMRQIVNSIMIFLNLIGFVLNTIDLTPGTISRVLNCSCQELFRDEEVGIFSSIFSYALKCTVNLNMIHSKIDELKEYVEEQKHK